MQRLNGLCFMLIVALIFCASSALAATPSSFCKCTCFSNSTIIPLDPATWDSPPNKGKLSHRDAAVSGNDDANADAIGADHWRRDQKHHALSCNDCNRKFCLDYDLPTCKGAKEEDVVTTCFQRDSKKDEAVVFIFIFATSALLAWAVLRPWVEKWIEAARERRAYIPVSESPST